MVLKERSESESVGQGGKPSAQQLIQRINQPCLMICGDSMHML